MLILQLILKFTNITPYNIINDMVTNRNGYISTFLILITREMLYYYGNEYEYVIR